MGKLVRCISEDGFIVCCVLDGTDIAQSIKFNHATSPVVTVGLGRLAIAGSMMGYMLKGEQDTLTLRMNGGGETGSLVVIANSRGEVKGYPQNPTVELPLNKYGHLDVSGAIGKNGYISVMKDLGLREPYIGQVPLVSGEVAEDITGYYATSEQIPTVCGLGVSVDDDGEVVAAGGFLLQLLPFADEACIDELEKNIKNVDTISNMIEKGMDPQEICELLLKGFAPQVLESDNCNYNCGCTRDFVKRALVTIGQEELLDIINVDKKAELNCHFCSKKYKFNEAELRELLV